MKLLEDRIRRDGVVIGDDILKVDSFLNHQIDTVLLEAMAEEWHDAFADDNVNKILTIEASGIAMAVLTAKVFDCPLLFAKKSRTKNLGNSDTYVTQVASFTHGTTYDVQVSKKYLNPGDNVLIIDDFLARGEALRGLIDLCNQAGANVVGCGIAIEKAFQSGGEDLRKKGYRVESLARIKSMSEQNGIEFA